MAPIANDISVVGDTYIGTVGHTRCHTCKLRGSLTDPDSNWRLWNADMKVYRDGAGKGEEDEEWASIDDEIITKMERRRKCILWFSVAELLRQEHLTNMGERDKTSEDVMRRLFEKVAPPGTKYQPLERLTAGKIDERMRESMRKQREKKEEGKSEKKVQGS